MEGTRELVNAAAVGAVLAGLSGVGAVAAVALALAGRTARKPALVRGALLAALAVLVYPLWLVYNRIEDHFGLDSVVALLLNGVLFILVGVGAGWALRRLWPRDEKYSS